MVSEVIGRTIFSGNRRSVLPQHFGNRSVAGARIGAALACYSLLLLMGSIPELAKAQGARQVDPAGTIHVPAFVLPESSLLDEKTRASLKAFRESAERTKRDLGPAFDPFAYPGGELRA